MQRDLARTLQYMADQEAAQAKKGRSAGLHAARDAFYRGDIAAAIARYHGEHGGWVTMEDMAAYTVTFEPPVRARFGDIDLYACGPWCQGPALPQALNIVSGLDLRGLGHNSPQYIHVLAEALKLVYADRQRYYGDPRFVKVPVDTLLSESYAAERRKCIDPRKAAPGLPAAGDAGGPAAPKQKLTQATRGESVQERILPTSA